MVGANGVKTWGAEGLNIVHAPTAPIADFIFIHGLRGGSIKTWSRTADETGFWPGQWLAHDSDFQSVRIFTFGYDADWVKPTDNDLHIQDFSQQFLESLHNSGHFRHVADLPIVLIAHSMGGLVAKKAFMLAQIDPLYSHIGQRFHSIYFLGTPHRGSSHATWLSYILKLKPGKHAYVRDLDKSSSTIRSINNEFRHFLKDLNIHTVCESLPTTGFGMIVGRDCATLNYPKEQIIQMRSNHHNLGKFNSPTDDNYVRLKESFAKTISVIRSNKQTKQLKACKVQLNNLHKALGGIGTSEDDLHRLRDLRNEGTCDWINEKVSYYAWRRGKGPNVLWLIAKPATGKTILSTYVIDELHEAHENCSYFFFEAGSKGLASLGRCLRTIAYQMAEKDCEIRQSLVELELEDNNFEKNNFNFIWRKVFVGCIFKTRCSSRHYWIIDALDECQDQKEFASMLSRIECTFPLRIMVTSRNSHGLREPNSLLIQTESISWEDVSKGIQQYILSNIDELPIDQDDPFEHEKFINKFLRKADGCFLWAKVVTDKLRAVVNSNDIDRVLDEIPDDMNALFADIISRASPSHLIDSTKAILMWLTCSTRALSLPELQQALELDLGGKIKNLESAIPAMFGQLVYIERKNKKVYLVHQTARDFLTDLDKSNEYAIDMKQGHLRLALVTLEYLIGLDMRSTEARRGSVSGAAGMSQSPFANYAATSFYEHIRKAPSDSKEVLWKLDTFLSHRYVLSWIEFISKSQNLDPINNTAKMLKRFLEKQKSHGLLLGDVYRRLDQWSFDLARLVSKFGAVLLSSPSSISDHVPPFCPKDSIIYNQFGQKSHFLSVHGSSTTDWDDRLCCIYLPQSQRPSALACDDRNFAVGFLNGSIIWYHCMGCQKQKHFEHGEPVKVLEFSVSSRLLVSGGMQNVRVWDIEKGAVICEFSNDSQCLAFLFAEDERSLLGVTRDSMLREWNLSSRRESNVVYLMDYVNNKPTRPSRQPLNAVFSRELRLLAANYRGRMLLWDFHNHQLHGPCGKENLESDSNAVANAFITHLVFSPVAEPPRLAAAYHDGSLVLFDPIERTTVREVNRVFAQYLSVSPDGRTLASGDSHGTIQLFEFETLRVIYRMNSDDVGIKSMVFSSSSISFYDIRGWQINHWGPAQLIRRVWNDDMSDSVSTLSTDTKQVDVIERDRIACITSICCDPEREYVYCGRENGNVSAFSIAADEEDREVLLYSHASEIVIECVAYCPSQQLLVTADSSARILGYRISELDGRLQANTEPVLTIPNGRVVRRIFLHKDTGRLLALSPEQANLYDEQGNHLKRLKIPDNETWQWVQHPIHQDHLALAKSGLLYMYNWHDLEQVGSSKVIPAELAIALLNNRSGNSSSGNSSGNSSSISSSSSSSVHRFESYCNGCFLGIEFKTSQPLLQNSGRQLMLFASSAVVPEAKGMRVAISPARIPNNIQHVIGSFDDRILYLDDKGWVCSLVVLAIHGGSEFEWERHFFIPADWLSTGGDLMFQLTPSGKCVFVKRDDLMVIDGGFDNSPAAVSP